MGLGDCGGFGGGGFRGYAVTLHSAPITLVLSWENVDNGPDGDGGAVPDGLNPGDGPLSLHVRFYLGTQAQLGLLLDPWVPL